MKLTFITEIRPDPKAPPADERKMLLLIDETGQYWTASGVKNGVDIRPAHKGEFITGTMVAKTNFLGKDPGDYSIVDGQGDPIEALKQLGHTVIGI